MQLRAATLRGLMEVGAQLSDALLRSAPEELDEVSAAMIVSSLVGAIMGATGAAARRGDSPEQVRDAVNRAVDFALRGLPNAPN